MSTDASTLLPNGDAFLLANGAPPYHHLFHLSSRDGCSCDGFSLETPMSGFEKFQGGSDFFSSGVHG